LDSSAAYIKLLGFHAKEWPRSVDLRLSRLRLQENSPELQGTLTRPRNQAPRAGMAAALADPAARFDAAYYARYYQNKATRVHGVEEIGALARGVTSLLAWYQVPMRTVLDVGAGTGLWRDWFRKAFPKTEYRSVELSPHACKAYGHEQGSIVSLRAKQSYDLVICQGVLPYLTNAEAERAIENLGRLCHGALYFESITKRDVEQVCDGELTDVRVHLRSAAFYRKLLAPHFRLLGAGIYTSRKLGLPLYELEAPRETALAKRRAR
jgi:hypothetical protein